MVRRPHGNPLIFFIERERDLARACICLCLGLGLSQQQLQLLVQFQHRAMPSAPMPLRQYNSQQAMRPLDGLRQHAQHEPTTSNGTHSHSPSNSAYQKIFPPIGVHDFQEFPTRRPNTANARAAASRPKHDARSPIPNFEPPAMHNGEPSTLVSLLLDK